MRSGQSTVAFFMPFSAIFAITQDPFIVYTSNIFAILGLRALYFSLAAMIHRFVYLKYALALVLVFIGAKIMLHGVIGKIPAGLSLGVTFGLLAGGILLSLLKTRTPKATVEDKLVCQGKLSFMLVPKENLK